MAVVLTPWTWGTWRPSIPTSLDGEPLVTTVSDLFLDFPYHRLPSNPIVALFLRPEVVIVLLVFYLVSKPPLKAIRDVLQVDPKSAFFRSLIALHNFGLAVFSGVVAWNSWRVILQHGVDRGFLAVYCDTDGTLWHNGFGAWSFIFYVSKFYEFVDTWILVLKGKPVSFLQVYHHTGIAFIMWCAVASHSAWLLFVVLLNSVIHTVMYSYYLLKTISPTTEIKAARYLTMAQIGQFFTGILGSSGVFFLGSDCDTQSSRFALALMHIYGYGLIALFFAYANRKYKKS